MDGISEAFGKIPKSVLVSPYQLEGQMFHVPGTSQKTLSWHTLLGWRKDLDGWMNEQALKKGVEIRDGVKVAGVSQEKGCIRVQLENSGKTDHLDAKFVIGADGAASKVRSSLFPTLKVKYAIPIRECYEGQLDLDAKYLHWFFPKRRPRPRFNVNFKGNCYLLEGSGIKGLRSEIVRTLSKYGFSPNDKPVWKDGCMIALLHRELIQGTFLPAIGNVALIGDAAGLLLPISFEGIGAAIKSGQEAAEAVCEASQSGSETAPIYLQKIEPIINVIRELCDIETMLNIRKEWNPSKLCDSLKIAYENALRLAQ